MLQGTLIFAVATAAGSAGLAFVGTGSILLAVLAYVFAGMAVLFALLCAEMLTGDSDAEGAMDEHLIRAKAHG